LQYASDLTGHAASPELLCGKLTTTFSTQRHPRFSVYLFAYSRL